MGYDISLKAVVYTKIADLGSCTYNVNAMLQKAIGKSLRDLSGMKAREVESVLRAAKYELLINPKTYRELSPKKGNGDYDWFVEYLGKLIRNCEERPSADFVVE